MSPSIVTGYNSSNSKKPNLRERVNSALLQIKFQIYLSAIWLRPKACIGEIEKEVKSQVKLREEFNLLLTIPGIGHILRLTTMLEVGEINRFEKVGRYSSYFRPVKSHRLPNGKKNHENNRKNGNRYLASAYLEAANFALRYCSKAQRFYQLRMGKTNVLVAIKSLSNKLPRASYYVMRDQR